MRMSEKEAFLAYWKDASPGEQFFTISDGVTFLMLIRTGI